MTERQRHSRSATGAGFWGSLPVLSSVCDAAQHTVVAGPIGARDAYRVSAVRGMFRHDVINGSLNWIDRSSSDRPKLRTWWFICKPQITDVGWTTVLAELVLPRGLNRGNATRAGVEIACDRSDDHTT